jgi:hypothetical protein
MILAFGFDVGWSSSYNALVGLRRYDVQGGEKIEHHFSVQLSKRFSHGIPPKDVVAALPGIIDAEKRRLTPEAIARSDSLRARATEIREAAQHEPPARKQTMLAESAAVMEAANHERKIISVLALDSSNDRSFVDHFPRDLGAHVTRIVITSGDTEKMEGAKASVSRAALLSNLYNVSGFNRLHIEPIEGRDALTAEIAGIQEMITAAHNRVFRKQDNANDDLVMALAMAVWIAGRTASRPTQVRVAPEVAAHWARGSLR